MARHMERAWAMEGAAGGLIAGIAFLAFEMVVGSLLGGIDGAFMPLRLIGAIVLDEAALDPAYALSTAVIVGAIVHLFLSVGFGFLFVAVVQPTPTMRSTNTLLLTASAYGLVLWLVNFYVLAPTFGWNWFAEESRPPVQLMAHTFFYGWILGLHLSRHAMLCGEDPSHEKISHVRRA